MTATVTGAERLSDLGQAFAAPARATMLVLLLGGTAHTGRELARQAGIAPSTASEHLAVLAEAGLIRTEIQGRHHYYRVADRRTAVLLERLLTEGGAAAATPAAGPRVPEGMAFARSCYDHLAGRLGVALHDRLVEVDAVLVGAEPGLTDSGRALLDRLGFPLVGPGSRPLVRQCLDWSQRRPHLAGQLGASLLSGLSERKWVRRNAIRPRELIVSAAGRAGLAQEFGINLW